MTKPNENFVYNFPAIRGGQAGKEFYTTMVKIRFIERLFIFNEEDLPIELRAQRTLSEPRAKKIAEYILANKTSYTLPSLTASIDATECKFKPLEQNSSLGELIVPIDAKIYLNDGQHRRYALLAAIKEYNDLAQESIPVTFYIDTSLEVVQQRFTDINSTASRPTSSLTKVYDHRDGETNQIKEIIAKVFKPNKIEKEKTAIAGKSKKLFAFNALYKAIDFSLKGVAAEKEELQTELAIAYWEAVSNAMAYLWEETEPRELRQDYLCTHGVILNAIGMVGAEIMQAKKDKPQSMQEVMDKMSLIGWERSNPIWKDRTIGFNNQIIATNTASRMAAIHLKEKLGLRLNKEEQKLEEDWKKSTPIIEEKLQQLAQEYSNAR